MKRTVACALVGVLAAVVPASHAAAAGKGEPWAISTSVYAYFVPFDDNYLQPTIEADRNRLHLELRYNYENFATASAWVGYNFSVGSDVSLDFTPMLGGVFGRTVGFAPGYEASLTWRALELSSEGEHFLDAENDYDSYFYTWTELTYSFTWVTGGLALQRTQAYESARESQRGLLLGTRFEQWGAAFYVFDPDQPDPTYVGSVYADF